MIRDFLVSIVAQSLIITGFVFVTMLVIEYLNVLTRGTLEGRIRRYRFGQPLFTALLAVFPGCIGNYAVVSLYSHRVVTFGALVAGMIASCGDEAFYMLALFPGKALMLFGIVASLGAASGIVIDLVLRRRLTTQDPHVGHYAPVHEREERCVCFSYREILDNWRRCSAQRGWLTVFLGIFLLAVLVGEVGHHHGEMEHGASPDPHGVHAHPGGAPAATVPGGEIPGHSEWGAERLALLFTALIGLLIVGTVPEHFLEEHLWNHLAKTHVWRIFLWTLGALIATRIALHYLDVEALVKGSPLMVLAVACLVGLIPESGPHLIFTTLFAAGALPFSILLSNSIVQEGHGMLPMLAHSRRGFLAVKAIKIAIALAVGLLGYWMGW